MWTVTAFISSVLLALFIGILIGLFIDSANECSNNKDENLSDEIFEISGFQLNIKGENK